MAGSGYRREAGAMDASAPVDEGAVDELIVLRMRARSMREYARADQLRDQLRGMGVAKVYTPKDFKITEIMGDVVGIVEKAWLVEG